MSKRITILGSTGSIGRQSLEVISACGMEAVALTANSSVKLLEEQARRYRPELAVLMDERAAGDLRVKLADTNVRVLGRAFWRQLPFPALTLSLPLWWE